MAEFYMMEDFGGSPQNTLSDDLSEIWSSIGQKWDAVETAAGDVAAQTWETVSSAPSRALTAVKEAVSSAGEAIDSTFSWFQGKILYVLAVVMLVLFLLAKSGILTQSADLLRAFYGG